KLALHSWIPQNFSGCVVHISHGMAEYALRYGGLARFLAEKGMAVFAHDHRGHGQTAGELENVGYLGDDDGFEWMVKDLHQLSGIIKKEYQLLPLILFGHSMGSYIVRRYIEIFSKDINAAVLCGSGAIGTLEKIGSILARNEVRKNGPRTPSPKLNKLTFGNYNKKFSPNRTEFDWLSRDTEQVDKYVADKYCGGVFSCKFFYDLAQGLVNLNKLENIEKIRTDLPLFFISGSEDPVGKFSKAMPKILYRYHKAGMKDIQHRLYLGARHELLNEINKDEVMTDIYEWINKKISR
nr:alpha/beta fold hydrolase [Petrotogaceae bacterium]